MKIISAITLAALCAALLTACGSNTEENAAACHSFARTFNDHDVNNHLAYAVDKDTRERLLAGIEELVPVAEAGMEEASGDIKDALETFSRAGGYFVEKRGDLNQFGIMNDAVDDLTEACEAAGSPMSLIQKAK